MRRPSAGSASHASSTGSVSLPSCRSWPDRLARGRLVDRAVEHVVGDLERASRARARSVSSGAASAGVDGAAHARAPGDQRRGLAIDDAEVVLDGGVGVAGAFELRDLALGHLGDRGRQRLDHRQRSGQRHGLQRARQAEVADQHDDAVAEHHARRGPAAPHPPVVDDVVVVQRRGVDQLGGAADGDRVVQRRPGGARRQHRQQRPQPLAARAQQVGAHLRDRADRALHPLGQPRLDDLHLVADEARRFRRELDTFGPADTADIFITDPAPVTTFLNIQKELKYASEKRRTRVRARC